MHEPTQLPHTLDAKYYTDPAIFQIEQTGLLARTWQFAGHASALENIGDYFTFEIAGQNLFCIKDSARQIRGFYNVCQHRAHELVNDTGNRRVIVCPYHAWAYELDGRLRAAPNARAMPGFEREQICLSAVRVEVFCGFVFVNLDPSAEPMDEWFPKVREELSAFVPDIEKLKPLKSVEVAENCNWKVSVENYSECYHCRKNHPTFANGVIKSGTYDIQPQGFSLRHTTECQNLDKMTYPIDLNANEHAGDYSSWYLWPLFSFQVYPGNILNTYHWRPVDTEKVMLWRGWYTTDGRNCKTVSELAIQDRATTVEEDIRLVESVQRGLKNRGYQPGPLVIDPNFGVNSEHSLQALQGWMRDAIDSNQETL